MKITIAAILSVMPLLPAQDAPDPGKPQVTIMMNQAGMMNQTGALAGSAVQLVSGEAMGGEPVTGSPYSAEAVTESIQTLAGGGHIGHKSTSMIYRDSDGRERRETSLPVLGPNQTAPPAVLISDPVAGVRYTLDTSSRTAHMMPAPAPIQRHALSVGSATTTTTITGGIRVTGGVITPGGGAHETPEPPKIEQLGTMTIEGVEAVGTRTTTVIPAGQIGNDQELDIVSERWYSPDLKVAVLTKHSDPRMGETVYRLTRVTRNEPVHTLFEVPADYTISDAPGAIRMPNGAIRLP